MALADVIYWGNPERRNKVVKLMQRLYDYMERNFDATEDLIYLLNNQCGAKITHIKLNHDATIQENCYTFTSKILEIQREIDKIKSSLSDKLKPEIYSSLFCSGASFEDIFRSIKNGVCICDGIAVAGLATIACIYFDVFAGLTAMATEVATVATWGIAGVVLGVVLLGGDVIISTIIGHVERNRLENLIGQLERALKDFEPKCKKYTKAINRVVAVVDVHLNGE